MGLFQGGGIVEPGPPGSAADKINQVSKGTPSGAQGSLVTTPSIRAGQSALSPGDPGYGTAQAYYNPMADATAAANQYSGQLGTLAGQSAQAGQDAQTSLNLTGSGVNNYALQQAGALSQVGGLVGGNLMSAGQGLDAKAAATAGRNVANPNYALTNNSIAAATNPALFNQQDKTLMGAAPNFSAANASLGQASPNYLQPNALMQQTNMDFVPANRSLTQSNPNYNAANATIGGTNLNFRPSDTSLSASQNNANALTQIENQPGPSAAQAQLQSGLNQSNANALAMARSGRGFGGSAAALNQAAGIRAQASQQAVNQSAMLRAQEVAAERQRMAQNLTSAAGIQQGASQQQIAQQQLASQLGMQKAGMQQSQSDTSAANALQRANLQQQQQQLGSQLGMQKAGMLQQQSDTTAQDALQRAQLQQAQQELASNVKLQTAGQYGQQAQLLSQQNMAGAGLELNQQQLSTQAALQQQQQNDAAAASLYGLGLGAQQQGGTLALQGLQSGAQLGMAGFGQQASDQTAAGQLGLAGLGQSGQEIGAAYGMQSNAIDQQQAFNNALNQRYATQVGNATASAGLSAQEHQAAQAAGRAWFDSGVSGVSSLLSSVGGAAGGGAMSDRNMKEDIKPANSELLVPSLDQGDGQNYDPYSQGVGISGPNQMQPLTTNIMPQQQMHAPPTQQQSKSNPSAGLAAKDYQQTFTPQQALAMSDEREKEAVRTVSNTPAYSYNYKDPDMMGAAEGRQYGIMAQDLEKTPAGRSVVKPGPQGAKMVDTSRLTMVNTAALNGMQKQIDKLNAIIASRKAA